MLAPTNQLPTDLLEQTDLFRTLGQEERAFLDQKMYRRLYKRGEVLVIQGADLDEIFLVASGLVSVLHEDESGTPTEVAQLGKGSLVGELSLLTGNLPNATVVAVLDTEVWALSHADFEALLSRSIPLALSVNRALGAKLAATNQRLAPTRVATLTAIAGDRGSPRNRRLPLDLAASIAWYTRERVLLIDCHPTDRSLFPEEESWGEPVDVLLRNPALLARHAASPDPAGPHRGARLIRYSANPDSRAEPGVLLSLATRLRSLYRHIIFDLPSESRELLVDTLPFVDNLVVIGRHDQPTVLPPSLRQLPLEGTKARGLLAVTGWPHRARIGEVWAVEEKSGWKVGSLIDEERPQQGIDRLARAITRLRVGIAWGGGTARGWALAGIANALEQLKIPMDFFAGTSAGALGAAVYGLSLDYKVADQRMREVLPYLQRTTRPFLPVTVSRHSLLSERWWNNLIRTFVEDLTFEDLLLPHGAVALDLVTGQQHVFTRGPLWQAIRASAAVPVVAPPIMIDGRPYADGGMINAVPLDVVEDMGADILIGIDLTGAETSRDWGDPVKPNMWNTLFRMINVSYNTAARATIPRADVLIRPNLRPAAVYDVSVMNEFIAEGERVTLEALPELRKVMPWLAA